MADKNINFTPVDADEIYDLVIGILEDRTGESLFPGDERRIFGEAVVAVVVQLLNYVNDAARQRLLRYARGEVLDAIAERRMVSRLEASRAHATVRFSAAAPAEENIIIPAGTKVATGDSLYFATDLVGVIKAGIEHVDIAVTSTEGGSVYTNLTAGTISRLVDLIPGVSKAESITLTTGGDDGETYDEAGDEHFRERIRLASAGYSNAGSEAAYRFFALSADPDIAAVSIANPEDGHVEIVPIMKGGVLPSQEVLDSIVAMCSADKVRPMTDYVTAISPISAPFDIELVYYIDTAGENATVANVEGTDGAIEKYILWQMTELGRDINPDKLRAEVLSAGAFRIDVVEPTFTELDVFTVAQFSGNLSVTHEVVTE
jgi:phage-related baseplate assembly protein